jgi:hypothetical protein
MMRSKSTARRGSVLALVVPILFVLFGLAALVIDLGSGRLMQRRMQSAANGAAIEALRSRDDPAVAAASRDAVRRQAASDVVSTFFAGSQPQIELTGGLETGTSLRASQLIQFGDPIIYSQGLKLNLDNEQAGDIVSGTFNTSAGLAHTEAADYSRDDFTPSSASDHTGIAVLVRLRLTGESFGGDDAIAGPPVPILFGRDSMLNAETKAQGLKVRATAIAAGVPVWSVGPANPAMGLEGYTPVAIRQDYWAAWLPNQPPVSVSSDPTGALTDSGSQAVGLVLANSGQPINLGQDMATLQADATAIMQLPTLLATDPQQRYFLYAPIYATINTSQRVIGFGRLQVQMDASGNVLLTKLPGMIAPRNATPRLAAAVSVSNSDFQAVLQANVTLQTQEPVLAAQSIR